MIQCNDDNAVRTRWSIALFLIALIGAALRFYGLGFRDFWFDESCTYIYVKYLFDWPEGSSLLAESTNLPYYLLLRGWVEWWGESEVSYRALSALAATLTIPMVAVLARRLADPFTALVVAVLVAVHPLHLHYAHEARAYALWILLLTVVLWSLHVAATTGRKRWWCFFGLTMLSALHLHYFTIYLVPATLGVVFLAADRRRAFRAWLISASLVCLAFVPYFVVAVLPASRGGGGVWIAQYFQPTKAIFRTLWAFLPAGAYPVHLRGLSLSSVDTVKFQSDFLIAANGISEAVPAVIVITMVALLIARGSRRRLSETTSDRAWAVHAFLGATALGPLLLAWIYSMAMRPNYLVARYDLVAWPAFMVWLALVITTFARAYAPKRSSLVALSLTGVLAACSMMPNIRMAALRPPPTIHHERAKYLAQKTNAGDLVVALSYDRDYLLYYLNRFGFAGKIVSFPSWLDHQIGWVDTDADIAAVQDGRLQRDAETLTASIREVLAQEGRVYLLLDWLDPNGTGERGPLHRALADTLTQARLRMTVADELLQVLTVGW